MRGKKFKGFYAEQLAKLKKLNPGLWRKEYAGIVASDGSVEPINIEAIVAESRKVKLTWGGSSKMPTKICTHCGKRFARRKKMASKEWDAQKSCSQSCGRKKEKPYEKMYYAELSKFNQQPS